MEAIPQNIKQFGNKSYWFTSPSEQPGRLTQTMMLHLIRLRNRERCPFHLRKPTSTKYFTQMLKEPKPQSRTPYVSIGKGFPCSGQLPKKKGQRREFASGSCHKAESFEMQSRLVSRSGRKPSVASCGCVRAQSEAFCSSW